jgi:hypothetical protein
MRAPTRVEADLVILVVLSAVLRTPTLVDAKRETAMDRDADTRSPIRTEDSLDIPLALEAVTRRPTITEDKREIVVFLLAVIATPI